MKFAHMADCHLGSWRQPELKELNFQSFQWAVNKCIKEKVDFVLISGDLFDSAYPSIDVLKETFGEFRKFKDQNIPVFLIAGSHDYSVSGKTFLDVLEKAGFCKNVSQFEERNGEIILQPTLYKNVAIYGYPGKKSSLEIDDLERIKLQDSPGLFKILMIHTAIRDAVKNLPIKAVDQDALPKVDYYALGHLHINYQKGNKVYSGPIFPNNITELEELKGGSFYIFSNGNLKKEEIKLKNVLPISLEVKNALTATDEIISSLEKEFLKEKILILKLYGTLEKGKSSDIDLQKIEKYARDMGVYAFLKSTSKLHIFEQELKMSLPDSVNLEGVLIKRFQEDNPTKFDGMVSDLIRALQVEKLEDERMSVFTDRIISETKKIITL